MRLLALFFWINTFYPLAFQNSFPWGSKPLFVDEVGFTVAPVVLGLAATHPECPVSRAQPPVPLPFRCVLLAGPRSYLLYPAIGMVRFLLWPSFPGRREWVPGVVVGCLEGPWWNSRWRFSPKAAGKLFGRCQAEQVVVIRVLKPRQLAYALGYRL